MILYHRSRTPYLIRVFFSGLTILALVFIAATIVIAYFAIQEPWPRTFGIWLLAAFVGLIPYAILRGMLKEHIKKIVQVEIIPNGLKIIELIKNEVEETIIPSHELQIDIITHIDRDRRRIGSPERYISYHLEILGKDNEKPPFKIFESKGALVGMLEKMEASKIVSLKLNEKDLINSYRNPGAFDLLGNFRKYKQIAIIIAIIAAAVYVYFFGGKWFFL